MDTKTRANAEPYERPRLTVLGTVHELTQGSKVQGNDGTLGMTKNS